MKEPDSKGSSKLAIIVVPIIVALIACFGTIASAIIARIPIASSTPSTNTPLVVYITTTSEAQVAIPSQASPQMATQTNIPTIIQTATSSEDLSSKLYVLGYTENDLAVRQASENCKDCKVIYLTSLNELPDNWTHHAFNLASPSANLADGCRSKQELINLGVTLMVANNYTPCPISYEKLSFAILVGVTNQTEFSLDDAANYSYTSNAIDVNSAESELSKVFSQDDVIYVVHVPNLRVTPGNPGSCKLFFRDFDRLKDYPLGWIAGGENIIPTQFKSSLQYCFNQ